MTRRNRAKRFWETITGRRRDRLAAIRRARLIRDLDAMELEYERSLDQEPNPVIRARDRIRLENYRMRRARAGL